VVTELTFGVLPYRCCCEGSYRSAPLGQISRRMFSEKLDIEAREMTCYEDKRILLLSETPGSLDQLGSKKPPTFFLPHIYETLFE